MPFYQVPADQDFCGCLVLGDRQLSLNFRIKGNFNTSTDMVAWNREPYNLTGNTNLTLNYSFDSGRNWMALTVDVSTVAVSAASVTCQNIADALNANVTFSSLYQAYVLSDPAAGNFLKIRALRSRERWKSYISNTSAESKLRFNKKAGVGELPSYFSRHTISNINNYTDGIGVLVELSNPVTGVDVNIVDEAGLDHTTVQTDWQLLDGRSGLFTFKKQVVDTSGRIVSSIQYPAGADPGDFAKKITMTYTSGSTNPTTYAEIPYTLTSADMVTPP